MQMIGAPPACAGLPDRTVPALDAFFEKSDYSVWFSAQQTSYTSVRGDYKAADEALTHAISAFNIQKAVRDTQYCDWKAELRSACAVFDTCYIEKSSFYLEELVPRVTSDMNSRIEVYKAGETLVHQIKFLLGDEASQDTPEIVTQRFEMEFPTLPEKGVCDLSVLTDEMWVPEPYCGKVIFQDSFEDVLVTAAEGEQVLCGNGNADSCALPAWHNPSHPSYVKLVSDIGQDWSTPFGEQSLQIFGFQRCPDKQACGVETSGSVLTELISPGVQYTLTFNVAARDQFGDYQVELAAVDEHGSTNWRDWTKTTLASTMGTTEKKDFSTVGKVVYEADQSSPVGQRLMIRLLDRDEGHYKGRPVYDNIELFREAL